jgi:hypothetical protein
MPAHQSIACHARLALALAIGTVLISACHRGAGLEADIRQRFVERYERELCIGFDGRFPLVSVEIGAGGAPVGNVRSRADWLRALEVAGLVQSRPLPTEGKLAHHLGTPREYSLTDEGARLIGPDHRFCYGRHEVVEVIDYTTPADVSGITTIQAEARLRPRIEQPWAEHPALAQVIRRSDTTVDMVLVRKAKGGWSPAY